MKFDFSYLVAIIGVMATLPTLLMLVLALVQMRVGLAENRIVYEGQTSISRLEMQLAPIQRQLLINDIVINVGRMAVAEYDFELFSAEMDLEVDKLEEACNKQEKDLAESRRLAETLYIAGGPLEYYADPSCHTLEINCERLPWCLQRWDCRCAQNKQFKPYPNRWELQKELDAKKTQSGFLSKPYKHKPNKPAANNKQAAPHQKQPTHKTKPQTRQRTSSPAK